MIRPSSVSVRSTVLTRSLGELNTGCITEKTKRPPGFSNRRTAELKGSMLAMSMIAMVQQIAS